MQITCNHWTKPTVHKALQFWRREPMKPCRECGHEVSEQALTCPNCGAPQPARGKNGTAGDSSINRKPPFWAGPWLHISFKFRPNRKPVPAIGIIAIGQFGLGVINIDQLEWGLFSVSQFTVSGMLWHCLGSPIR